MILKTTFQEQSSMLSSKGFVSWVSKIVARLPPTLTRMVCILGFNAILCCCTKLGSIKQVFAPEFKSVTPSILFVPHILIGRIKDDMKANVRISCYYKCLVFVCIVCFHTSLLDSWHLPNY